VIKVIHGKFESIPRATIGSIDLIIADPPDNIGLKYDGFSDKVPTVGYKFNLQLWLSVMANLTKGPIFFTFNEKWTREVENAIEKLGIPLIQRLQWHYTFGQDQTRNGKYALCYRPIYWLNSKYVVPNQIKVPSARQTKYNDKRAAKGGKMPENVWEFPRVCGTFPEKRKFCPTQLPEAMVERIIKGHCCPGGRVLDPFMGTGTTARVCQRMDIDCVTIEVSKPCVEAAAKDLGVSYE
jgi:site-specific DNA-methyltransferase (adenine-specific)